LDALQHREILKQLGNKIDDVNSITAKISLHLFLICLIPSVAL
jgi:hypothetical protein